MTVVQFVNAVYKAWSEDPFLSGAPVRRIRYRRSYGMETFSLQFMDKTSVTILIMEDGRISFF